MAIHQGLKIEIPSDPAIPLHTKNYKSFYYKDTCTRMFIAALFTIAKTWKQPKRLSTDEWTEKIGTHTHNAILFSHKKEGRNLLIYYNMDESGRH